MHCGRKSFHIGVRARGAGRAAMNAGKMYVLLDLRWLMVISLYGQPITTYSSIATHQTTWGTCSFGNFSFDSTTVKIREVMLIE